MLLLLAAEVEVDHIILIRLVEVLEVVVLVVIVQVLI
jgi:hypothetical protein